MGERAAAPVVALLGTSVAQATTVAELAGVLRQLRRREARRRGGPELTYRELALQTGWSLGIIGEYLSGKILPPTDRFDTLVRLLGATPAEQGALATARDRVEDTRRSPGAEPAGATPIPRQLPSGVAGFTGRAAEVAALDALALRTGQDATAVIAVIAGTAGVGKTSLAVQWAHGVTDAFPGGQLYVNLRGFDPGHSASTAADVLSGFLEALGVRPEQVPGTVDAQAALYRSLLSGRRVLILLDNARDAEQVRPLLPGTAGSLALITSRQPLASVITSSGAELITLDLFTRAEARRMLAARLGAARIAAESEETDAIVAMCARLPLALAVVAFRAAVSPHTALRTLLDQLRESQSRLDEFADVDPTVDVRSVLSWSYRALSAPAAQLFRYLGAHPGPDIDTAAAASVVGATTTQIRAAFGELQRAGLVAEHAPGRFTFHDLLRAYAVELATPEDRRATTHRMLDHYLHSAQHADELLNPLRGTIEAPAPAPGVVPRQFADAEQALEWCAAERPVLLRAIHQAADEGLHAQTWQLAWLASGFFHRRGHWRDQWAILQRALEAARRLGDPKATARVHNSLGQCNVHLGRYAESEQHHGAALELSVQTGDVIGQANSHMGMSWLYEWQRRLEQALEHGHRALELYESAGDRAGWARALNVVGWRNAVLGRYDQTLDYCGRAVPLLRELGDRHTLAATLHSLGYAHHQLGELARARTCYEQALELCRGVGDRHDEATVLSDLGDMHLAAGAAAEARDAWERALESFTQLGHADAERVRAKLIEHVDTPSC